MLKKPKPKLTDALKVQAGSLNLDAETLKDLYGISAAEAKTVINSLEYRRGFAMTQCKLKSKILETCDFSSCRHVDYLMSFFNTKANELPAEIMKRMQKKLKQ